MSGVAFSLLFYWEWDEVGEWFLFVTRKDRSLLSLPTFIFWKRTESESVSQPAMPDSVAPWTAAHQAPLSVEAKILEWVAMLFSRGSSQPRD